MKRKHSRAIVPCNGCTLCCQGDAIRLEESDAAVTYQTEPHPRIPGMLMIAYKPNGDCIYLTETGCGIHNLAPSLCRAADCRAIALKFDFETARRLHALKLIDIRVWDRGRQLVEETKISRRGAKALR